MVSQRELLQETFADVVRGIGAAAKVMAPGLVSSFQAVAEPFKAFRSKQPTAVLKEALKTTYFNTFDYKTVKIGKPQPLPNDRSGTSRISIKFTAERIKGVSSGSGDLVGGYDGPNEYTAILTRDKKGVGGEYRIEIRDKNNKTIAGEKDKKTKYKPSWSDEYEGADFQTNPTVEDLADWFTYNVRSFTKQQINSLFPGASSLEDGLRKKLLIQTGTPLTDPQINDIKNFFIQKRIVTENHKYNKQQLSQLNFLKNSYNLVYEVSINKGN